MNQWIVDIWGESRQLFYFAKPLSDGLLLGQMTSFAFVEEIQRYLKRRNLEINYSDGCFMLAAFFQVLRYTLSLLHSKMADNQNLPTSAICFCINAKDPKQMKQQKAKAILGRLLGCFPVRFVAYREPFWHVLSRYQKTPLREAESVLVQKFI